MRATKESVQGRSEEERKEGRGQPQYRPTAAQQQHSPFVCCSGVTVRAPVSRCKERNRGGQRPVLITVRKSQGRDG